MLSFHVYKCKECKNIHINKVRCFGRQHASVLLISSLADNVTSWLDPTHVSFTSSRTIESDLNSDLKSNSKVLINFSKEIESGLDFSPQLAAIPTSKKKKKKLATILYLQLSMLYCCHCRVNPLMLVTIDPIIILIADSGLEL